MEWEEELQLYNFKARYYDPYTMRFIQPDPVHTERSGFDNYDRYSYVNNNPVNFVDPDGRVFSCFPEAWFGHFYSGPSSCDRELVPKKLNEKIYLSYLAYQLSGNEIALLEFNRRLYQKYIVVPTKPKTPLDRVSLRHDNEVPARLFSGIKKWDFVEADWNWIKGAWGTMLSTNTYKELYQKEYEALPDWTEARFGRTGRSYIATIATIISIGNELFILGIGTLLFELHIIYNLTLLYLEWIENKILSPIIEFSRREFNYIGERLGIRFKPKDFIFNVKLSNIGINNNRFKNILNPLKWRL
ncbi:MAG: hypothetical protein KatS3mg129_2320 [Leptospiraceae bacterium]|nr:MAG: hypothetical protein KatS3mg129_2320 [Leptospiraceae bacterium]